jgi:hypothetical protein
MTGKIRGTSRRLLLAVGGLVASAALVLGAPTGLASAQPGDNEPNPSCFGIPECNIPGFNLNGRGGGGYLNGTAGGAFAQGKGGGGYLRGEAGGAFARGQGGGAFLRGMGGGGYLRGKAGGAWSHFG